MNKDIQVSYAKTVYGQKEIDAVVKCLNEGTQAGKYVRDFEQKVARLFSKKYGLFVNSGSSALYIGMESENFQKGSEIITPALTFSTTVGCIVKSDLIPVFVDVNPTDYCIDVSKIESAISDKTVAILAPNLLGNLCQWDKIRAIADKHHLKVIEDSADTLGATLNGKLSGSYVDWSITSFYGSHIINCAGNGGMLCLNDNQHLQRAKLLRSWGRSSSIFDEKSEAIENRFNIDIEGIEYDAKFVFETIGYNLEGSEIGASFGLIQLENLENNIEVREQNFKIQSEFFKKFDEYFILPHQTDNTRTGWLAYPIQIRENAPFSRTEFQIFLEKNNIQTRTVFTGDITKQPGFKNIPMRKTEDRFVHAENIMRNGVLLACHHGLTIEMLDHMHERITTFVNQF